MGRYVLRRLISSLIVLLAITYLSFLAQDLAYRARANLPAPLTEVAREALRDSVQTWRRLPQGDLGRYTTPTTAYRWQQAQPLGGLIGGMLARSIALLMLSMLLGGLVGGMLGLLAAASRRRRVSLAFMSLSIAGVAMPSFLLAMLLQYAEIYLYRSTGHQLLPVGGFGWDGHLVLPVLVLSARPTAHVARLTFVRVSAVLEEDYVRTARAKGLLRRTVWSMHILRNAGGTILTAMGTSLRFALSSLPVVEVLFGWPGAAKAMLDMLRSSQRHGATVLLLIMGAFFVVVNVGLDLIYRALDPRLREMETRVHMEMRPWQGLMGVFREFVAVITLQRWRERRRHVQDSSLPSLKWRSHMNRARLDAAEKPAAWQRGAHWHHWRNAALGNPALILGVAIGATLLVLVVAGPSFARHNPYSSAVRLLAEGQELRPPLPPSATFPFGTDSQGRDILSLLLVGARRTLTIAFFAVLARLMIGGLLGFVAGWVADSKLDRALMGLAETLAAFPALLLAMLVVYAVGVRQGMAAFVIALACVGWGEVMQTIRNQVMRIKPMAYIESAVATGLSQGQILSAHVLPNVWPTMVSLAFLEMGAVLMILGELGFLGVFIGGGLGAEGEYGLPAIIYYDIPEWSVMLANSWRSFRSHPWATFYPGLAFFLATLGFLFLGEGLRWLTERLTLTFRGLFNRYTMAALLVATLGTRWMLRSTSLYSSFAPNAQVYNGARALDDIGVLSSASFEGRLAGTEGSDRAAEWIAQQFEQLGLQPAGDNQDGYYQNLTENYRVLSAVPDLVLRSPGGAEIPVAYGSDFVEHIGRYDVGGLGAGEIVIVASGAPWAWNEIETARKFGISRAELERGERIILQVWPEAFSDGQNLRHAGLLTMAQDTMMDDQSETAPAGYQLSTHRYQMPAWEPLAGVPVPHVLIRQKLVERLLPDGAPDLDELVRISRAGDQAIYLPTGWRAELAVPTEQRSSVPVRNVIAFWPGKDMIMDSDAVIVTAYYDGLGRFPDGTLYPGANDNASGVATMFEIIRTLKESDYAPKRTIIFVAWIGGEFHERADMERFLEARIGFAEAYKVIAAVQIEGVGTGSGEGVVVWRSSSERLDEVIRRSARQVKTPLAAHAVGLHADPELWPDSQTESPSVTISWAGSDAHAHTPADTVAAIDKMKLDQVGRMLALSVMVLASDPAY